MVNTTRGSKALEDSTGVGSGRVSTDTSCVKVRDGEYANRNIGLMSMKMYLSYESYLSY